MLKWWLIFGGYCACLFISAEIYSFVYDVEPNTHYINEYMDYHLKTENQDQTPLSLQEWMDRQDQKVNDFWYNLGDQCDAVLNPWYEPDWSTDNRCRD